MQKTMKAAIVEKFGEPLTIRELPLPTPGAGTGAYASNFERRLSHGLACG